MENTNNNYLFARKTNFQNVGEDVALSARHKRNLWRGIADFENNNNNQIATKTITRDFLLKNDPFKIDITLENSLGALIAFAILRRYPKAPEYPKSESFYLDPTIGLIRSISFFEKNQHVSKNNFVLVDLASYSKKIRQDYVDFYSQLKSLLTNLVAKYPNDIKSIISEAKSAVGVKIRELRANNGAYYSFANDLVSFSNKACYYSAYRSTKRMAISDVMEFYKFFKFTKIEEILDKTLFVNSIKAFVSGEPFAKIFKKEIEKRQKGFDVAKLYAGHAYRKGDVLECDGIDFLTNDCQIRALQFGNSMTDSERARHTKLTAEALWDLARILGIKQNFVSGNGQLALAFGARGKANSLAHYESPLQIINLTRLNGVGSLAHEWAHFLDNLICRHVLGKSDFLTANVDNSTDESHKLISIIKKLNSELNVNFRQRLLYKDKEALLCMGAKYDYWTSRPELFARAFETYLDNKLTTNNLKNTYLVAGVDHCLWPTNEENLTLTPIFDELFACLV